MTLEKPALHHARSFAENANNRKISTNLRDYFPNPYTEADGESFMRFCIEQEGKTQMARIICIENRAVGCVSVLFGQDVSRFDCELGYWLGEKFWGQGVMSRAVNLLIDEVFENTPIVRVHAKAFSFNKASCRVLEKAGFTLEGVLRKSVYKGGEFCDSLLYARIKDDASE